MQVRRHVYQGSGKATEYAYSTLESGLTRLTSAFFRSISSLIDCRYMKRSWSLIDQPNEIAIATNRVSSTLVGTLSNVLPRPFYALHRSTNKDDMFKYFQDLVKLLPRTTVKVTLVLDNHSVSHQ